MDHYAPRIEKDSSRLSLGKYYAQTVCATCHGNDLRGVANPPHPAPSLIVMAKAYNPQQFIDLLKTGRGIAREDLGLMSVMSQYHFKYFTDHEIESIHEFLQTLKQ